MARKLAECGSSYVGCFEEATAVATMSAITVSYCSRDRVTQVNVNNLLRKTFESLQHLTCIRTTAAKSQN